MSHASANRAAPAWEPLRAELVRFVASRVGDASAADDIVHDVLLRALDQLAGPEPPAHLRAWLYRVTRNAIVDYYRARRPTGELPEEIEAVPVEDEATAERELASCLAPLLGTLPLPYREALTLAEVEGLTQAEIAKREGLSLSGAKSRVQRARKLLRDAIVACCRVEVDRRGGIVGYQPQPQSACEGCATLSK